MKGAKVGNRGEWGVGVKWVVARWENEKFLEMDSGDDCATM